jgi:hypothetical protein
MASMVRPHLIAQNRCGVLDSGTVETLRRRDSATISILRRLLLTNLAGDAQKTPGPSAEGKAGVDEPIPRPPLKAGFARKGLMTSSWLALLYVKISDYRPITLTLLQHQHVANSGDRIGFDPLRHGCYSRVRSHLAYPVTAPADMVAYLAHKSAPCVAATWQRIIGSRGRDYVQQPGDQHGHKECRDHDHALHVFRLSRLPAKTGVCAYRSLSSSFYWGPQYQSVYFVT